MSPRITTASALLDRITERDALLERAAFGIWMLLGETDRAFRDFDPGPKTPYIEALWSDDAAHLRADVRFEGLLERLNFTGPERALLPGL